jgi:hypothetical protein
MVKKMTQKEFIARMKKLGYTNAEITKKIQRMQRAKKSGIETPYEHFLIPVTRAYSD